jgi:hypothetical protein
LGIVFDEANFVVSRHAVYRWCSERVSPDSAKETAVDDITKRIKEGNTFLTINNHRYIKNGELLFPCAKLMENTFIVKTVLQWKMVERRMITLKEVYLNKKQAAL